MDSIFGIGLPELFFIAILSLIILGPERLPGTLRQVAKGWGYLRNLGRELTSQFSEEFKDLQDLNPRKLLNDLADEELAKDLKTLNENTGKKTTTAKAVSTTTKPASAATAKATTTKASTATGAAKATKPAPTPKAVETSPTATGADGVEPPPGKAAEAAKAEATTEDGAKTILPPQQSEPAAPAGQPEAVKPVVDAAGLAAVTNGAPISVNGASDTAESAG
jgi:sec-independent protein translocase protein TatB